MNRGRPVNGEILSEEIFLRGWTQSECARRAGLSDGTVWKACQSRTIDPGSFARIVNVLVEAPVKEELSRVLTSRRLAS